MLDVDDKKHIDNVGKHDLIGELECSLADIVTAGQQYKRTIRKEGMMCCGDLVIFHEYYGI